MSRQLLRGAALGLLAARVVVGGHWHSSSQSFAVGSSTRPTDFLLSKSKHSINVPNKQSYIVIQSIRGGGAAERTENDDPEADKSTMLSSVFNLVNNVAGAGILTLAAGMAPGTGWIPAMLICGALGYLSGHTFAMIGEACELTGEEDFKVCVSL
jgi:hypothetical protein